MTNLKISNYDKTQIVIKIKNKKYQQTKKTEISINSKNPILLEIKNSNCDILNTQYSNWDQT